MVPIKDVVKCEASSTVKEVLNLMMHFHVSSLVIVLEDKPTGIITKTDLCWCYQNGISLDTQIGDVMPWTAEPHPAAGIESSQRRGDAFGALGQVNRVTPTSFSPRSLI